MALSRFILNELYCNILYIICSVYPSPLVNVRGRKPVYVGVGQTILNKLIDFSSASRLPQIDGLVVNVEKLRTVISIPRSSQSQVSTSQVYF